MKKEHLALATGAATGLILSLLFLLGIFSNIQLGLVDSLYGGKIPLDNIAVAAVDDKSLQEIGRWPWNREVFAELLARLDSAKVIVFDVGFFEASNSGNDTKLGEAIKESGKVILAAEYTSFASGTSYVEGKDLMMPIDVLKKSPAGIGYVNVISDGDGVTRAVNTGFSKELSPLSAEAYRLYFNKPFEKKENRYMIDFVGSPYSFKYYSIADILDGKISEDEFKSKIIFIGSTAHDLHDEFLAPTSKGVLMPGVEVHANILQTMINNNNLHNLSKIITIILIIIFAIGISFLAEKTRYLISIPAAIAILIAYIFFAIFIFSKGIIMNLVYIPLSIIFSYVSYISLSYMLEKKEKKQVLDAFGRYVSPILIKEIMKDYTKLKLGGEKRNITILFSDVRDFTSISEKLTPEQLVHLLNEYLSEMTKIILKKEGLVDKYIGDAIMAFWNAPLDIKDHEEHACLAALEMIKRLKELQKEWEKKDYPKINIGIGLNTGPAVVGNMGSMERFDYTAMGDTVNLSSRLEGLTKYYHVNILISQNTHSVVKERFLCRKLDLVAVKGKKEPIAIYELLSKSEDASEEQKKLVKEYEEALSLYFKKEFKKAYSLFEKLSSHDQISAEFVSRCREFEKNPPENSWNGVWVMKTK